MTHGTHGSCIALISLTVDPLLVDLHAAPDAELAVLVGEGDPEGEGGVGDVVVEVG